MNKADRDTLREHLERMRRAFDNLTPEERTPAIAAIMQGVENIASLSDEINKLQDEIAAERDAD